MAYKGPVVLKIGGSLIEHGDKIIQIIKETGRNLLIIPGGGIFSDTVRRSGAGGTCAHWMAIAAMDQYGWYLSEFGLPTTDTPCFMGSPHILLPYLHMLTADPLPHSWDITSDTISAYYADLLSVPLIILKSIEYIRSNGKPVQMLTDDVVTDDLDPECLSFLLSHELNGKIILGTDYLRLKSLLIGDEVEGTTFGRTI